MFVSAMTSHGANTTTVDVNQYDAAVPIILVIQCSSNPNQICNGCQQIVVPKKYLQQQDSLCLPSCVLLLGAAVSLPWRAMRLAWILLPVIWVIQYASNPIQ